MVSNVVNVDPREVEMLQQYLNEFGQQIEAHSRQLEMFEQRRIESLTAAETLKNLSDDNGNTVLLPLGGGASIRVNVADTDKVLLNIGSDVIVERTGSDTIAFLNDRVREIEAMQKKIAATIEQIQKQAQEVAMRIETASKQAQMNQQPGH